jgi:hypothetical protein
MEELLHKLTILEEENNKLKMELEETKEHLKKYTAPKRSKKYYETHKEELLKKNKMNLVPSDKKKEYNQNYYLKKKAIQSIKE